MMRVLALLLVPLLLPGQTPGKAGLTVRIVDPSGSIVPNASITLAPRNAQDLRRAETDELGQRSFHLLRPGEYLVQAEAQGFGSGLRMVTLQDGASESIEVKLQIAALSTQVQVTAAGVMQTAGGQSKAIDIVDASQIEERAAFSSGEAVRTVPGIRGRQLGGPGSLGRVTARGMRPYDTSVLIDGFRFRDAAAPQGDVSSFLGDLLIGDTARVEVLRGSGSSLYGTHATGGVINI